MRVTAYVGAGSIEEAIKNNDHNLLISCPICGETYFHIIGTDDLTKEEAKTNKGGIAILLYGECGHELAITVKEHKGQAFFSISATKDGSIVTQTWEEE